MRPQGDYLRPRRDDSVRLSWPDCLAVLLGAVLLGLTVGALAHRLGW